MERNELKTKILALLERNARISTKEIAERLACEEALIAALIDELEKSHVIMGYAAIVSDLANSSEVRAIIEVEVQPERDTGFDKIAERLGKFPEVRSVYLVSGRYDLRLEVVGSSLQESASFVASKLSCQNGVKSTATYFMLKKYKEAGITLNGGGEENERLKIVP